MTLQNDTYPSSTKQTKNAVIAKGFYGNYNPADIPLSWKNANGITYGTRKEIDVSLEVKYGELPLDIFGVIYVTVPSGSVNSGGLPYPPHIIDAKGKKKINPEYGSPILGGDGMVMKFDFNSKAKVKVQSKLMKVPSLIADEKLKSNERYSEKNKKRRFKNFGILRLSSFYGVRNLANTAIIPFKFKENTKSRLAIAYDLGRHFEINPKNLSIKTPIGRFSDWKFAMPNIFNWAFPMIQSTAHPSFDAETQELFSVNYTRSLWNILSTPFIALLHQKQRFVKKKHISFLFKKISKFLNVFVSRFSVNNEVILMRWKGEQEIKKWRVIDEEGNNLIIRQSMHQTEVTEKYIILSDASFKTTPSVLINTPFPNHSTFNVLLRKILGVPMLPYLRLWMIDRKELSEDQEVVKAKQISKPIPLESIHFSVDYSNPKDIITIYLNHNVAACASEWLRPYDRLKVLNNITPNHGLLGMYAIGGLDLNKFGKFKINALTGEIIDNPKFASETGKTDDPSLIGAHTWELNQYTYRDMISAKKNVAVIEHIFCLSSGLDPRMLTEYTFNMYKNRENRTVSVADILEFSREPQASCMIRIDTHDMTIGDYYQFPVDWHPRSIQFVPKLTTSEDTSPQQEGYIWVTLITALDNDTKANFDERKYTPEVWLFKADNLKAGPICILGHQELNWGTTLHSTWVVEDESEDDSNYNVDLREDFEALFNTFQNKKKKEEVKVFFEKEIYPEWYKQKTQSKKLLEK